MRPGELLLLDAGVETDTLYTADVTRTLPIDGRFDEVQAKIYQAVYDAQEAGMAAVRPGGVVAYVTCSPVQAETSDVITDVVASLPGTEVLDATAALPGVPGVRSANPLFAQLWPHRHGTDAIFIALLRRPQAWRQGRLACAARLGVLSCAMRAHRNWRWSGHGRVPRRR